MKQQLLLLEQQQGLDVDAQQQLLSECKVDQSCGMQQAPAEQNFQAKSVLESISAHVREQ
eukprot:5790363-Prorocentrum_lima.AAC.1